LRSANYSCRIDSAEATSYSSGNFTFRNGSYFTFRIVNDSFRNGSYFTFRNGSYFTL